MKECAAYNETRQSHVPPAAPTQEHLSVIYEFCDGGSVYEKIPGES